MHWRPSVASAQACERLLQHPVILYSALPFVPGQWLELGWQTKSKKVQRMLWPAAPECADGIQASVGPSCYVPWNFHLDWWLVEGGWGSMLHMTSQRQHGSVIVLLSWCAFSTISAWLRQRPKKESKERRQPSWTMRSIEVPLASWWWVMGATVSTRRCLWVCMLVAKSCVLWWPRASRNKGSVPHCCVSLIMCMVQAIRDLSAY